MTSRLAVGHDTVLPWRTNIAERVVFPAQTCVENRVHVHVWHSVGHSHLPVAETFVNSPHLQSFGNLLMLYTQRVASVPPLRSIHYLSIFVNGGIVFLCHHGSSNGNEQI